MTLPMRRYFVVSADLESVSDFANLEGAEAAAVAFGSDTHVIDMMSQPYIPAVQRVEDGVLVYVGYGSFNRKLGLEVNLIEAAKKGQAYAVRAFLARGADPDGADKDGSTPLLFAIASGCETCVRVLLQAGADPLRADNDGVTPRDLARMKKRHAIEPLLREK